MPNSVQMAVGKRLTVVDSIGSLGNGDSLKGQNVQNFPDGAVFYVTSANRLYHLRKNLDEEIIADTGPWDNVVDGVGSSAVNGRFVAVNQYGTGTLTGPEGGQSAVVIEGFDLSNPGEFLVCYTTGGGSKGFLVATATGENEVTVTSSQSNDTSGVLVSYLSQPVS